jgi:hypothetical protein
VLSTTTSRNLLSTKGFQAVIEKKLASTGNPGNKKQVTAQALRISDQKVRNFPSVSRYTRDVAECGFLTETKHTVNSHIP